MKLLGSKPGPVQRGPEAVAGTGEVMAGSGGVKARIDADEQDLESGRDHVPDAPVRCGGELFLTGPGG